MEELLTGLVVAEESVPVHVVQLTVGGRGTTAGYPGNHTHIKAKQLVQPSLNRITIGVADGDREGYLL